MRNRIEYVFNYVQGPKLFGFAPLKVSPFVSDPILTKSSLSGIKDGCKLHTV